ncbi:hypothetical protein [Nocardia callitridis]|uniref:DUF8176 domain-containing protein n=1 Tax=Nocardia callitridis TaxID=648753 RepID=A0ABP9KY58_9NOCA
MTSEGDARENESGRPGSGFGPPLEDFGSSGAEFGPPVSGFGPPMGGDAAPQWPEPDQETDHPDLSWRPAEPETVPPPPPQYRAPDSTVFGERPAPPPRDQYFDDDGSTEQTVRHSTTPPRDDDNWWNTPSSEGDVPKPPPETPGMSWSDDPIARRLQPRTPAPAPKEEESGSSKRRLVIASVAAAVVLIAVIGTIFAVSGNQGGDDTAAGNAGGSGSTADCPASQDGKVTTGNGSGDTDSGPGAILGFQHAFYVDRSGALARKFVADDASNIAAAATIQGGIDEQIPAGTKHCLRISEISPGTYSVELKEDRPNGEEQIYPQIITTVVRGGKHLLYSLDGR